MAPTVDSAFEALARFRWPIVAFWILAVIGTSAAFPSLSSEVNNNSAFLAASSPSQRAANLATPVLGGGANGRISDVTIVASRSGPLTAADVQAIARGSSFISPAN